MARRLARRATRLGDPRLRACRFVGQISASWRAGCCYPFGLRRMLYGKQVVRHLELGRRLRVSQFQGGSNTTRSCATQQYKDIGSTPAAPVVRPARNDPDCGEESSPSRDKDRCNPIAAATAETGKHTRVRAACGAHGAGGDTRHARLRCKESPLWIRAQRTALLREKRGDGWCGLRGRIGKTLDTETRKRYT